MVQPNEETAKVVLKSPNRGVIPLKIFVTERDIMKNANDKNDMIRAHEYCANHKTLILKDKKCGCFFCMKIFSPAEIIEWIDDDKTALCPNCCIDAIIGESSGFPITKEFLEKMHNYWF